VPDPDHKETDAQLREKWKKLHPDKKLSAKPETLETQVVVIGGGGAGLTAAVAAAEKGADVIVLERRRQVGGNSRQAGQVFAVESELQKRLKIDIKKEQVFKDEMTFARWKTNPRIWKVFLDKSGDTIRWLEEQGVTNFKIGDLVPGIYRTAHIAGGYSFGRAHGGSYVIGALAKTCAKLGVRVLCETRAQEILTDDKKGVTGVLAIIEREDLTELTIKARSVIITTGGFGGNKELLSKYCSNYTENMLNRGIPNMGDGILMAMKSGAATEGLGTIMAEVACYVPGENKRIQNSAQQPYTLWVNKTGERFMDEAFIYEHNVFEGIGSIINQPDHISYTILDERIKRKLMEEGPTKFFMGVSGKKEYADFAETLQEAATRGNVKISDSWDDIARWIGATPKTLKATIDEYNSSCEKGFDENFYKNPKYLIAINNTPYYALKCTPVHLGTYGGIKINHRMEVLNHEDNPILGLYAGGADAGGFVADTYCQHFAAVAYGFALNSGRIAGENAAKFVQGK
jgi:fumarate reductase flavoprotein subunit